MKMKLRQKENKSNFDAFTITLLKIFEISKKMFSWFLDVFWNNIEEWCKYDFKANVLESKQPYSIDFPSLESNTVIIWNIQNKAYYAQN